MPDWERIGPRTQDHTDVFTLRSEAVGDDLQVTVATPMFADAFADPLPTIYLLDPVATFDIVVGITRSLSLLSFGAFPPVVVVGVGYDADPLSIMSMRFRDLTPTAAELPALLPAPVPPSHGTGGADRFLAALTDEVMPYVEQHHRASGSDRTFVGWSLGGLFGAHALLTRPEVFTRYLLVSPSLWWDDGYGLRTEEATAVCRDAVEAQLYLAVGEREESASSRAWPMAMPEEAVVAGGMVTNATAFARRLRSRGTRGLDVELEILPDEHHATVFPSAASRGLLRLFTTNGGAG